MKTLKAKKKDQHLVAFLLIGIFVGDTFSFFG